MLARESLDEKQLELYYRLELDMKILNNKIEYEFEDALDEDLLPLFTAINDEGYTLIGTFESVDITRFREVLNEVQKRGLLQDIVKAKILSSKNQDEVKSISLIEYITDPNRKSSLDFLHAIQGSCGLESFWKVISEDDRERIKTKLNEDEHEHEHKDVLGEINRIEEIKSEGVQIDNTADDNLSETSLASDESTINSKSNSANESELRKDAANKAIVAGAICGVIAGLAVGGGLFAAGVALPILALIGIAVAAALVTGLVAGGITYKMSNPSEKIDSVDTAQKVSRESEITA